MKHRLHTLCVLAVLAAATEVRAAKPQTTKQRTHTHNLVVAHKTGELYSVLIGDESLVEINNVKRLLDSGVSVNAVLTNVEKDRPITEAAGWGNLRAVQLLLKRGADVNATDGNGHTALRKAANAAILDRSNMARSVKVLQILLAHRADPDIADAKGITPLDAAAFAGNSAIVTVLLRHHADPNRRDRFGRTPIEWASYNGYLRVVQILRAHGAKISSRYGLPRPTQRELDGQMISYLVQIGEQPNEPAIINRLKYFLNLGANPSAYSAPWNYGITPNIEDVTTPLRSCFSTGAAQEFALLLAHRASVEGPDEPFWGPNLTTTKQLWALESHKHNGHLQRAGERLLGAVVDTDPAFTRLVLHYGAPVNVRDREGKTPVMLTHTEAVLKVLLAHGADINARDNIGETPLMQSTNQTWGEGDAAACDASWAEVLLRHGADTNRRDHNRNTALTLLAKQGEYGYYNRGEPIEFAQMLLAHGARTGLRNKYGHTALQIARQTGAVTLTRLLRHTTRSRTGYRG